ncbi:MAG: exodeoxyribonuclease VII large subunit [Clostridia bacterium]|nr:exodeoxyribonuclease VII large subunit [Clostridia bacterium]
MDRALQVSQLNKIIKDIIDNQIMFEHLKVVGEVSSFSITRGTAYFCIKDNDSMLNCVMFNCKNSFNIGDNIIVEGSVRYYSKGGKLTFTAYDISLAGEGELYKQFVEMKHKLESEGLFDELHKKPIPSYMKRVGVITSKTGAVIQDIINVSSRRNPNLDIVLYDVQVQGVYAKEQIIEGINFFSEYDKIDCIILARGGGSIEDLQPFNEEEVARAVYNCQKPIISAVGHETDFTIVDFVSDLRAPTPSAAAELVAFDRKELKNTFNYYITRLNKSIDNLILDYRWNINNCINRIEKALFEYVYTSKYKIINCKNIMDSAIENMIKTARYRVGLTLNTLDNLNPAKLLAKGYSVVKKEEIFIKDYSKLKKSDIITVENNKNILKCEILENLKK